MPERPPLQSPTVFSAPRLLSGAESLLLASVGAVIGVLLTVHLCRRSGSTVQAATALAAALVASSLAVAPVTAWAVISDLRNARELTAREAERSGPEGEGLDTAVVDRLAALIPRDATYALAFSPRVHPDHALVFRLWALSSLLPRVAVANPAAADWIVGSERPRRPRQPGACPRIPQRWRSPGRRCEGAPMTGDGSRCCS